MRDLITKYSHHQNVRGFSAATIRRREFTLKRLAVMFPDFARVTPDDVEEFLAQWSNPTTRYAIRSDLMRFYSWAVRRGHLAVNPVADVDPPRVPKRDATPITLDELRRVLEVANRDQRRCIMLGAYAGLRCAEIAALDAADVQRDRGVLIVRQGKGHKDGIVPLAPELAMILPHWGKVVCYPTGQAVGAAIRRAYRRAGVSARAHDLRHMFGTAVAIRSGGNIWQVARLMRHETIGTAQRYVRWSPDGADIVTGLHDAA